MLTSRQIADCLHDAGLRPGDSVMLHSSYKSLGGATGSPAADYGACAAALCGRHHLDDTCVGANSPWALNAAAGGWIVLLGVTHDCNLKDPLAPQVGGKTGVR